ncbi:hypothetical protein Bbelb_362170 [Branchiostoma belcheri]|nr:hypothetical protein Bbelb_362170 [Branchiostoma belcheri]
MKMRLNHGSFVHVTVVAENEAALRSVVHSDPILVDLTAPHGIKEEDVDFQQSEIITLHWNVTDDESGVDFCQVALGLSPGSGEVHQFTQQPSLYSATFDLSGQLTHGDTVYSTVRCHNYAGMTSHVTSDGVTIVTEAPNSDHAIVETMAEPQSYYPTRASHQSNDDVIHLSCEGFFDVSGIRNYQCRVTGPGLTDFPWIDVGLTGQTHATLSGLQLHNYNRYDVHVRAVNHVGVVSHDVTSEIYVERERPLVEGGKFQSLWPRQGVMAFDWTGVFLSNSSLIYEVSIGTKPAGSDVMQWRETEKTDMRLDDVDSNKEHYVVITATAMLKSLIFNFAISAGQELSRPSANDYSSAIFHHLQHNQGHSFKLESTDVLDRETRWWERGVKEAIYERMYNPTLNREGGLRVDLSGTWDLALPAPRTDNT